MKESFYFTHDFNAHDDGKIKKLLREHGTKGYGIYWYLIELLASETEKWYLARDYDGIAFDMREECDCIKSVIEDFDLFELDEENFWNKRLDKHFDERAKKSKTAKANAAKRWSKQDKRATAMQPHKIGNAIKERKEKKGKEIKETINGLDKLLPTIEFDEFWELYPKKTARTIAMKAWNETVKNGEEVLLKFKEALIWQMKDPSCFGTDPQFQPKPQDYILGERWNDVDPNKKSTEQEGMDKLTEW